MAFVRIRSSMVLNERFELPAEGLAKTVTAYQKVWRPKEKKIMTGLTQITGLTFFLNVIDCYVVNTRKLSNLSDPVIIGGYKPKEFVHVLTHELIHILADDNQQNYNWHAVAQKTYPKLPKGVAYHVMTNAVFESLYTDVMHNTDIIIWAIKNVHLFSRPDLHQAAWDVIEKEGYQSVLQKIKAHQFVTPKQFAYAQE